MTENPNTWIEAIKELPPEWMGVCLAAAMSALRVVYDEQETKPVRVLVESLICGALSMTATSAVMALNLDMNWSIFVGGAVGFFGVATVRLLALKVLKSKVGS